MGDIIGSRMLEARQLRQEFIEIVSSCNNKLRGEILSPYTITLGDEFQGIARSLPGLLEVIFYLEETSLRRSLHFKMRYVGLYGEVETPLNRERAHGMMGPGLTRARELLLSDKKRGKPRFRFELADPLLMRRVNSLFLVVEGIAERWAVKDGPLIVDMINNTKDTEVARIHRKNRSLIWRRRRTLLVEEFRALRDVILDLAQ
jgi:hypothetical protein